MLVSGKLDDSAATRAALDRHGVSVAAINRLFAVYPNLPADRGAAGDGLLRAIDAAAAAGAPVRRFKQYFSS